MVPRTVSGDELYSAIITKREDHHDTLYCTPEQEQRIFKEAARGITTYSNLSENVLIAGLQVITMEDLVLPIVCEKGEVFPLAGDWK